MLIRTVYSHQIFRWVCLSKQFSTMESRNFLLLSISILLSKVSYRILLR